MLPVRPSSPPERELTLSAAALEALSFRLIRAGGSSEAEASRVAHNLVLANLSGHDSHGVGMLPRYVASLRAGVLQTNRHARIELDTASLLRVDGAAGYGQVVGYEAMQLGIERALASGVCVVALHHAHHLGRIGHFAEQCLEAGLVSLHFVNVVARPIVAAFGGRDARSGTNPVCIGVPRRKDEPLLLDFATSRIAQGKTRVAHNQGRRIAPGMLLDAEGDPSTDPRHAVVAPFGALLPFGEHKGFGLAVVAELLGGALTGGPTSQAPATGSPGIINGMFSVLVDAQRLGTSESFERQASAYADWVRASRVSEGTCVMLPGDFERAKRRERRRDGILVDRGTFLEILAAGEALGLAAAECRRLAGVEDDLGARPNPDDAPK